MPSFNGLKLSRIPPPRSLFSRSFSSVRLKHRPPPPASRPSDPALADERYVPSLGEALVDSFGRLHSYLRISITDRCNFRCQYCMPKEGINFTPSEQTMTPKEIFRVAKLLTRFGVNKIRITGGEPTVRSDFDEILTSLGVLRRGGGEVGLQGLSCLALTTNGATLPRHMDAIRSAKVNAINISLDSLVPAKVAFISRTQPRAFSAAWKGVEAAMGEAGILVKLNCVVMKGFNDDELVDFVNLTRDHAIDVRFIEYMPFQKNGWSTDLMVSQKEMVLRIRRSLPKFDLLPRSQGGSPVDTAQMFGVPGYAGRVGFISSMSNAFCATCNRIRLTADGKLKNCLFGLEEFEILELLREGKSDEEIMAVVAKAVEAKAASHGGVEVVSRLAELNRPMIRIGG